MTRNDSEDISMLAKYRSIKMKRISEKELQKVETARVALFEWFETLDFNGDPYQEGLALANLISITGDLWEVANRRREDA